MEIVTRQIKVPAVFSEEVRKKHFKACGVKGVKKANFNHLAAACKTGKWKKERKEKEKASVKVVATVETAPLAAPVAPAAAPATGLNSVQVVPQIQQPA